MFRICVSIVILVAPHQLLDAGRSIGIFFYNFHIAFVSYELVWKSSDPKNNDDIQVYTCVCIFQNMFLIQSAFESNKIHLWSIHPLPNHVSYSRLIQMNEHPRRSIPPRLKHVSYSICKYWKQETYDHMNIHLYTSMFILVHLHVFIQLYTFNMFYLPRPDCGTQATVLEQISMVSDSMN